MSKQTVEAMVEGGKASAAPPLGPALGPTGVNIGNVVTDINKKTAAFKGMQVPVKIHIDETSKEYTIEIGTPPTSNLLLKEAGAEKGSGMPHADKIADLLIEQIIKVAKMKEDVLAGRTLKEKVKAVLGTCVSMGILVEGKDPRDVIKEVDANKFEKEIKAEKTELSQEELKSLEEEKKKLAEDATKRKAEEEKKAADIMTSLAGKEKSAIKAKLREAGISESLVLKLMATVGGGKGAAAGKEVAGKSGAAAKGATPAKK